MFVIAVRFDNTELHNYMKLFIFFFPGLAQLLFKNISSVKIDHCNNIVLIPCYVSNLEAENINELFLKWKFGHNSDIIFVFDGYANRSAAFYKFSSAHIFPSEFLKGNASLNVAKKEVKNGKYTCEVTELSREGHQTVDLKYTDGKWHTLNRACLLVDTSQILTDLGSMFGGSIKGRGH